MAEQSLDADWLSRPPVMALAEIAIIKSRIFFQRVRCSSLLPSFQLFHLLLHHTSTKSYDTPLTAIAPSENYLQLPETTLKHRAPFVVPLFFL